MSKCLGCLWRQPFNFFTVIQVPLTMHWLQQLQTVFSFDKTLAVSLNASFRSSKDQLRWFNKETNNRYIIVSHDEISKITASFLHLLSHLLKFYVILALSFQRFLNFNRFQSIKYIFNFFLLSFISCMCHKSFTVKTFSKIFCCFVLLTLWQLSFGSLNLTSNDLLRAQADVKNYFRFYITIFFLKMYFLKKPYNK